MAIVSIKKCKFNYQKKRYAICEMFGSYDFFVILPDNLYLIIIDTLSIFV